MNKDRVMRKRTWPETYLRTYLNYIKAYNIIITYQ
jgi:hypothetical protein